MRRCLYTIRLTGEHTGVFPGVAFGKETDLTLGSVSVRLLLLHEDAAGALLVFSCFFLATSRLEHFGVVFEY